MTAQTDEQPMLPRLAPSSREASLPSAKLCAQQVWIWFHSSRRPEIRNFPRSN